MVGARSLGGGVSWLAMRARKIRCGFGVSTFGFDTASDWFDYAVQCEAGGVD